MTILTRLVVVAALFSLAFGEIALLSPSENYAIAAKHARASSYHRRAPHVNAASRQSARGRRKRNCRAGTPTTPSTRSKHHSSTDGGNFRTHTNTDDYPSTTSVQPTHASNPSSSKKGLAWSNNARNVPNFLKYGNIKYIYNWGANPPQIQGLTAACMLWSPSKNLEEFIKAAPNYPILMGPNEINLASQANMGAAEVVKVWNEYIRPHGQNGKILVSPSVTSNPSGLTEMKEILNTCGGSDNCGFDYISLHFYGETSQDLITYVTKMYNALNQIPIWLSEFGCKGCENPTQFMQEVVDWCESTSWIAMYSPWGIKTNVGDINNSEGLIDGNGEPTALAKVFLEG